MPEGEIWSQYWHYDRIASCFDGAGQANYADDIAEGWRRFFDTLSNGARILDLCTGNGAAALIAAETARERGVNFRIVAVDQADIDPASHVSRHGEDYASIIFLRGTEIEALPFPRAGFAAVISQYGIEYTDLDRSLPEAVRMLAPGGRLRFVIHAADGAVAHNSRLVMADADLLIQEIDLPGHATRCFEAVLAAERGDGDSSFADRHFAAFQNALERTARHVPQAADRTMFKNSGAVLLDTFQRRAHFDLEQLLAKAEQIRTEIAAHRGRLDALVRAARDAKQADAMAERLNALGGVAASRPLEGQQGLIGHVVAARFP